MGDRLLFVSLWLRQPLRIAAVAPSSRALAEMMTDGIDPGEGPVIELGAGTGVFTRALISRGVRERDLVLVETNPQLANRLEKRFPFAHVVAADAAGLEKHYPFGRIKAGAVVSGLPFLSLPHEKVSDILQTAFLLLRNGASFYQFTYGFGSPVAADVLRFSGLKSERIGWVAANLPPASVYRFSALNQQVPSCTRPDFTSTS